VTALADTRPPDARMEDIVCVADFERRTGITVRRCECGAGLLAADDSTPNGLACAGCRVPASFNSRIEEMA